MFELKGESKRINKQVTYFDKMIVVPEGTMFIATDEDGAVYAFSNLPEKTESCWRGYGETLVAYYDYVGDWRESLYQVPLNLEN